MANTNDTSFALTADDDQEIAHMVALASDEAFWNYLDEVDLRLEVLEAEGDFPSEEF